VPHRIVTAVHLADDGEAESLTHELLSMKAQGIKEKRAEP
jgi:hypothetical protein